MAKIFYSMAGEGRGHATRVRTMVEHLRHEHELVLFASDDAFDLLAPRYPAGTPNVDLRRIPGLRFHYRHGRLDLTRSVTAGGGYLNQLPGLVERLTGTIQDERPDLVITDFEPALPRAARAANVPLVSLDHQHFLVACDLSALPVFLRGYATLMSLAVRAYHSGAEATIVSSFFKAPLRRHHRHVVQIGPLLRPELKALHSTTGHYLLSYLRPSTPPQVLEALSACGREVRIYGLGERAPQGQLTFHPLSEQTFARDLAGCAAMVGAAGNQSLGEALYFGKPVLALPEEQHHEQLINAHFLQEMGCGHWTTIESFEPHHLTRFLDQLDTFGERLAPLQGRLDGTPAAVAEIRRFLPAPRALATCMPGGAISERSPKSPCSL